MSPVQAEVCADTGDTVISRPIVETIPIAATIELEGHERSDDFGRLRSFISVFRERD